MNHLLHIIHDTIFPYLHHKYKTIQRPTIYEAPAIENTLEKPKKNAMIVGSIEPKTEAHPFVAQAQGISFFFEFFSILRPRGNGMPKRRPRGAMRIMVPTILDAMGIPSRELIRGEDIP